MYADLKLSIFEPKYLMLWFVFFLSFLQMEINFWAPVSFYNMTYFIFNENK